MNPYLIYTDLIQIKWYSILLIIGMIISFSWMIKEGKKFSLNKEFIINIMFWTIIFGIIGARIWYVVFNWDYFGNNLSDIYKMWNGGIAIHGGLIFGIITILIYSKKYKVNSFRILDMAAPVILLAQSIGRWGNFFNGEAYGPLTTPSYLKSLYIPEFIIEGMKINGAYHIPTFLYESLWCLLGVIIILIIRRLKYLKIGYQTGFYMIWYSIGRFYIESLRTDSLMFKGFKVAQFVSIALFIIGIIIILFQSKKPKLDELYNNREEKIIPQNF